MRIREPAHVEGCGHLPQNIGHSLPKLRTDSF